MRRKIRGRNCFIVQNIKSIICRVLQYWTSSCRTLSNLRLQIFLIRMYGFSNTMDINCVNRVRNSREATTLQTFLSVSNPSFTSPHSAIMAAVNFQFRCAIMDRCLHRDERRAIAGRNSSAPASDVATAIDLFFVLTTRGRKKLHPTGMGEETSLLMVP